MRDCLDADASFKTIAIDPVETGFQGSRNVARDAIFESRQAKPRLQEVPFMEETPPENKPGFA